jgi:hypothetical protein
MLETNTLIRYKLMESLKVYAGLNFGMDGWTMVGGLKLAGVKLLVPFSSIG